MLCAAAVWLRPHIELIVGAKVWPWGATPTGSCISRRAGAVFLHLFHTCQVPWVKLGAEHNITKAGFHGSELWSLTFLPSGSWWRASQRSDIDNLLGNQTNEKTFFSFHKIFRLWLKLQVIKLQASWCASKQKKNYMPISAMTSVYTIYSIKMATSPCIFDWNYGLRIRRRYLEFTFQIVKMDLHILYL